jgi:thiamine-monophosphate kinase
VKHLPTPEFDRIAKAFGWDKDPSKIGDDAAVLPGRQLLCCDALAEGVHFRWDWSTPADVGWKAAAQNVADILAMGGLPAQAVWSVGMGRDWSDAHFAGLARGAKAACKAYGCELVGGDTVRCLGPGFVSLSLLGRQQSRKPWARSSAKPGDVLLLAGQPGWSAAGLAALSVSPATRPPFRQAIVAHRRPNPPIQACQSLFDKPIHAAIDLSDGLSSDAGHVSAASGVRLVFDRTALEPSSGLTKTARALGKADAWDWVFHGGEDHAILATASPVVLKDLPVGVRVVGRVEEGRGVWMEVDGKRRRMPPLGWIHA